jgi:enoyl-CoA hydratase/carnithine racemase
MKGDSAMEDRIRLTIEDGIADVRLNRADKMNALDPAMFRAIAEAGARLREDRSLRAVVLSGGGRASFGDPQTRLRNVAPQGEPDALGSRAAMGRG